MTRPIEQLLPEWEAAEARLYPVALTRPEIYARSLELVGEIVEELAPYGTSAGLAEAFDRAAEIAAAAIERSGTAVDGLDTGLATAAAFAMRYRSIVASQAREEVRQRIERAREGRWRWVTLADSGDAEVGPAHRLEMHVADGRAVRAWVGFDAETGDRRFHAELVRLDPSTGEPLGDVAWGSQRTYTDADAWEAAVGELRAEIDGGASG